MMTPMRNGSDGVWREVRCPVVLVSDPTCLAGQQKQQSMRLNANFIIAQGVITERAFSQLVQQLPEQEKENGKDFLELLQMGITDVVFVKEG